MQNNFIFSWNILGLLFISLIFYSIGEYVSKLYSNNATWLLYWITMLSYSINVAAWLPAIQKGKSLVILGTIWTVGYSIATLLVSQIIFKEPISQKQFCGVMLSMLGVILIATE